MWLFEKGPASILFNDIGYTLDSLKTQEGVSEARIIAINKIQNNDLTQVNHPWSYGQGEFYDGMANGNIATSFLGTYTTHITITPLSNGQHQLSFHVENPTSWESATRLRIDNDGDGNHDGIFPNHVRDDQNTLHLGGNFDQDWYWTEIIN